MLSSGFLILILVKNGFYPSNLNSKPIKQYESLWN